MQEEIRRELSKFILEQDMARTIGSLSLGEIEKLSERIYDAMAARILK